MSLNDIHLPLTTIADLYKTVLIQNDQTSEKKEAIEGKRINKQIETAEKNEIVSIHFLGNNKKQITILVNYNETVHLPDDRLTFLTSILTACKLNLDDIALLNFSGLPDLGYKDLLKTVPSKSVLFFGVDPKVLSLPFNFPNFQVQPFDGINYLISPSLDEIERDKSKKEKLWLSLKKIFNL